MEGELTKGINQNDSEKLVIPLEMVGGCIRKAREEKHLSIEELANGLRIGHEQLIALENGQEDLLPEPVFIKAMIRRVAERLHIDSKELISQIDSKNNPISNENIKNITAKEISLNFKGKHILFIISPVFFIIPIVLYIQFTQRQITIKEREQAKSLPSNHDKGKNTELHIVKKGQTLFQIANIYKVPVNEIINFNKLNKPNKIPVGTRLYIRKSGSDS